MAIAQPPLPPTTAPGLLTYEMLLAEPPTAQRYDIVDGVRIVANPTPKHQRVLYRIAERLTVFERATCSGEMYVAPLDVQIRRNPLRTRQPDVLFISNEKLAQSPPSDNPAPFPVGPEIVVEILSPSEARQTLADKVRDYQSVGVLECWVVSLSERTVEVLALSESGVETAGLYGHGDTLRSNAFPNLSFPVAAIFEV